MATSAGCPASAVEVETGAVCAALIVTLSARAAAIGESKASGVMHVPATSIFRMFPNPFARIEAVGASLCAALKTRPGVFWRRISFR